jgi:hypothetical protein
VPKISEETAACRLRGARTSVRCRRLHGKRTGRRPYRAGGAGSTRSAATPGLRQEALDAPRAHDRARELPAGTEKPPGGSGGEPAPGAVAANRGGASIDGLCRLGGGSRHLHGTSGLRRPQFRPTQAASIAAGVARWRTAARHTHACTRCPSTSQRTHTASGVDETAIAATRLWVPSFAGTHARTGRRPAPSTGPPIASGESEYRASSGAVYLSRRRLPTHGA